MNRVALYSILVAVLFGASVGCSFRESRANPVNWFKAKEVKAAAPQPSGFLSRASDTTAGRLGPLFTVGAMLVAAGVLGGFILRSAAFGASVAGTGFSLIATGVLFTEYPWIVLVTAVAVLCFLVYTAWLLVKGQKQTDALAVLTKVIEEAGEAGQAIKDRIKSLGSEAVLSVKSVVSPIKAELSEAKA